MNLIPNKYYKCSYGDYEFYLKYKNQNNFEISYYFVIVDKQYVNIDYKIDLRNQRYSFHEVNINEIIEYLPKNHPDRIFFRKQRIKNILEL